MEFYPFSDRGWSGDIRIISPSGKSQIVIADSLPRDCIRCGKTSVKVIAAIYGDEGFRGSISALAVCYCTHPACNTLFVTPYVLVHENNLTTARRMSHVPLIYTNPTVFSGEVEKLSPIFCETYNQAARAYDNQLLQICGAGFRRALEFLVKDYAIASKVDPTDAQRMDIARMPLSTCITSYLPLPVQEAAKRAAWLGNDETHYYRVWTANDISDLRALIDLTVKYIDFNIELNHYVSRMPDGSKGGAGA